MKDMSEWEMHPIKFLSILALLLLALSFVLKYFGL